MLAGITTSGGGSGAIKFPVTPNALQKNLAGTTNAFLCIIDPTKSGAASLVYSSFLGGDHDSQGHSVAVDPSGRYITVAGFTTSLNFPTTANAYREHCPAWWLCPIKQRLCDPNSNQASPAPRPPCTPCATPPTWGQHSSTARDDVYGMTMDAIGAHRGHGPDAVGGISHDHGRPHHLQ